MRAGVRLILAYCALRVFTINKYRQAIAPRHLGYMHEGGLHEERGTCYVVEEKILVEKVRVNGCLTENKKGSDKALSKRSEQKQVGRFIWTQY